MWSLIWEVCKYFHIYEWCGCWDCALSIYAASCEFESICMNDDFDEPWLLWFWISSWKIVVTSFDYPKDWAWASMWRLSLHMTEEAHARIQLCGGVSESIQASSCFFWVWRALLRMCWEDCVCWDHQGLREAWRHCEDSILVRLKLHIRSLRTVEAKRMCWRLQYRSWRPRLDLL